MEGTKRFIIENSDDYLLLDSTITINGKRTRVVIITENKLKENNKG